VEQFGEESFNATLEKTSSMKKIHLPVDDFIKKCIIGLFLTIVFSIILRK
jgi:hypothetical protein